MSIIYNNVDISPTTQPSSMRVTDNAGGKPDSLTISFPDTDGLWSKWKPAKNDTLQVIESGFDTGLMYIDQIAQSAGSFGLKALSIPQPSKTARSQGWENVRLLEIVAEIAARYGFQYKTYDITNLLYERVDQQEEADFTFLASRCLLEGYALKISNRNLVIYNEAIQEVKTPDPKLAIIRESDIIGGFEFSDLSTDIYEKCIVRSQTNNGYISGEYIASGVNGPTLKRNEYATNQAEANRWAKGILRSYNKHMITGSMSINLNTNFAAGTNVNIENVGLFDGKYFIHRIVHDLISNKSILTLRKPLEGY